MIKPRFYNCLVAKSALLEFRGSHAKFFSTTLYVLCPLLYVFGFLFVSLFFGIFWFLTVKMLRPLREKGQCIKVSWEGDIGESVRHLATYIVYSIHYNIPVRYLSLFYRWVSKARKDYVSCPGLLGQPVGQFSHFGKVNSIVCTNC